MSASPTHPRGRRAVRRTTVLMLASLMLATFAVLPSLPVAAAGGAAPSDVKVIGRFEALRVTWSAIGDETNLVRYSVTGTPSESGADPLSCTVAKGSGTECNFSGLSYGAEYSFVVRSEFNDSSVSAATAVSGKAGISMSVVARAVGTTDALVTPRLENDIFVSALVPGSLTGNDFDLWACPDDSIIPRDGQPNNGDCDGPNIEGRGGRDDNTFLLGSGRYGRFCNWLIIVHDYSNGAHSNWFGPLLGADGNPLSGCANTLAAAPGSPPVVTPTATPSVAGPAPSPVADPGGDLPVVSPGSASGSVGGAPVVPTPARPNGGTAEFRVGTVETRIDVAVAGAGSVGGTGAAPVIRAVRDRVATISGGGMRPGDIAEVWLPLLGGGSRQVALLPIGADGTFDGALPFTGELDGQGPLPIGNHTIQLFGRDTNGQLTVLNIGVRIEQPGPLTPEPDRGQGAPPTLTPGQSLATNAGVPTPVTVTPLPDARSTRIQGAGWLMDVDVPEGTVTDDAGAPLIEIVNGTDSVVRGTGFLPGTRAYVWLMSTPTFLGQVTVNADGTFSGAVPIDGVPAGQHTLQLSGVGTDGFVRAANLGVVLLGDGMPRPTRINAGEGPVPTIPLPFTGMLLAILIGVATVQHTRTTAWTTPTPTPNGTHPGFDQLEQQLHQFRTANTR
jgi:hypothetical protein